MGQFYLDVINVESGAIQITDPTYFSVDENNGSSVTLKGVKNGKWQIFAYVVNRNDNTKVKSITIYHDNYVFTEPSLRLKFNVKSYSGQVGFFDYKYFKELIKDKEYYNGWYDYNSLIPLNYIDPGTIFKVQFVNIDPEKQSVLTLAEEDDEYPIFVSSVNNEIVSITIVFEPAYEEDKEPVELRLDYDIPDDIDDIDFDMVFTNLTNSPEYQKSLDKLRKSIEEEKEKTK